MAREKTAQVNGNEKKKNKSGKHGAGINGKGKLVTCVCVFKRSKVFCNLNRLQVTDFCVRYFNRSNLQAYSQNRQSVIDLAHKTRVVTSAIKNSYTRSVEERCYPSTATIAKS